MKKMGVENIDLDRHFLYCSYIVLILITYCSYIMHIRNVYEVYRNDIRKHLFDSWLRCLNEVFCGRYQLRWWRM